MIGLLEPVDVEPDEVEPDEVEPVPWLLAAVVFVTPEPESP